MRALIAAAFFAFALPALAQERPPVTVFVDVNVVPMVTDQVRRRQTVIVRDGKIEAIAPRLAAPAGARVIDGRGTAWLSPGLVDGHVHSDTAQDMKIYLANGITTVFNMGEASNGFVGQIRPLLNSGARPGPHVYVAFVVDGGPRYGHFTITTPDEARAVVGLAKTNGYDFIKVYNNLSAECFAALIEAGKAQGVPIVGHGIIAVGVPAQLAAGQRLIAHMEEFLYTGFSAPGAPPPEGIPPDSAIPAVVAATKASGGFVGADLVTYGAIARQWGRPQVVEGFMRRPEIATLYPGDRISWRRQGYAGRTGDISPQLAFLGRLTKAMSVAGVPLISGTDAPTIPGVFPGGSLHDNLDALQAAGLSPFATLATATRTPGELIARDQPAAMRFGTITPGARADLILTAANPLESLPTLRSPLGVMAAGRWYDAAELQGLRSEVAAEYDRAGASPPPAP